MKTKPNLHLEASSHILSKSLEKRLLLSGGERYVKLLFQLYNSLLRVVATTRRILHYLHSSISEKGALEPGSVKAGRETQNYVHGRVLICAYQCPSHLSWQHCVDGDSGNPGFHLTQPHYKAWWISLDQMRPYREVHVLHWGCIHKNKQKWLATFARREALWRPGLCIPTA